MQETFTGCRVTVMGLGTFGGGIAAARFLSQHGAEVTVTDLRTPAELSDSLAALSDCRSTRFRLAGHDDADFAEADLIVASPAVKPGNSFLGRARHAGATVTSELQLFWERCPARIIGVTGSNGKSTTATLIHDILKADGRRVWLGGNIGRSLLGELDEIRTEDWVVLELSSFQLAALNAHRLSPHVAVVTNFTPNHLDWHGSVEAYAAAKAAILKWQTPKDIAVRHQSGPECGWATPASSLVCRGAMERDGSTRLLLEGHQALTLPQHELTLHWSSCPRLGAPHQRANALLAAATGLALRAAPDAVTVALESFSGIPHRLQFLGDHGGHRWINDSASTTPESTIAALEAAGENPVLIVGGAEKGCDLRPLSECVARRASAMIVLGEVTQELIADVDRAQRRLRSRHQHSPLESILPCETLPAAVDTAVNCTPQGGTILFSPGFSSGSMFRNFADRGQALIDLVHSRCDVAGSKQAQE